MNKGAQKLVIGSAQFGMSYGIANVHGRPTDIEIKSILDFASKHGINTIDTAKSYGDSEHSIGSYVNNSQRKHWKIITKIDDQHKGNIISQLEDSKNKLNLRPYALLAHSSKLFLEQKFQDEIKLAKEKSLVKKIGVSIYEKDEITKIMNCTFRPDIIQIPMNILDTRLYKEGILSDFDETIELHVRSVFLQGLFFLSNNDIKIRFKDAFPYIEKLKMIAFKANLTLAELSLLWLISLKKVKKILIGIDNKNQLKMHLKTIKKRVKSEVFNEALLIDYKNRSILNPSLWR